MAGALPQSPQMYAGSGFGLEAMAFTRRYPDGTIRRHVKSTVIRKIWTATWSDISATDYEEIEDFWRARVVETTLAGASFTFTDPVSGGSLNGIFIEQGDRLNATISASCRYSLSLTIEEI